MRHDKPKTRQTENERFFQAFWRHIARRTVSDNAKLDQEWEEIKKANGWVGWCIYLDVGGIFKVVKPSDEN